MKNPLTPAGIEPSTFRFVAQHLNHCATAVPGKAISVTYSERVFVVLGIHYAMRMHHIVIPCLPGSTIFFHIIS